MARNDIDQHWLDDSICNALMAADIGQYDGLNVTQHLEIMLERVREAYAEGHNE